MGKYLHLYSTEQAFEADYNGAAYLEPWVSLTLDVDRVDYNKAPVPPTPVDPSTYAFTLEALESGTITWPVGTGKTMQYTTDGGATWQTKASNVANISLNVSAGDEISFKAVTSQGSGYNPGQAIQSTASFNAKGNAMSLIYGDDFETSGTSFQGGPIFQGLFMNNTKIASAENLILPVTALTVQAYSQMFMGCTNLVKGPIIPVVSMGMMSCMQMFNGCTSLTTAPELPATTLAQQSCYRMFSGCTSLTTAQTILPAMTLASQCYQSMFQGCTNLTTAPELPAPTLVASCYQEMFQGCTNLSYIKCLATSGIAHTETYLWVSGVSSSGTFVRPASSASAWADVESSGPNNGIPSGWTVQDA